MTRYAKLIVALVGAVCTWATTYFPDSHYVQLGVGLASALVTVVTVYLVPNTPPAGQPSDPAISEQDPPVAKARHRKGTTGALDAWLLIALLVIAALVLGAGVSWWFLLLLLLVVLVLVRG